MRFATGLTVFLTCIAVPAWAADPAPSARTEQDRQQLPPGTLSTQTVRVAGNFRVRIDTASAASAPAARLQPRLAGSMIDFYPREGAGFHLSAGSRMFAERDLLAESNRGARGLFAGPRGLGGTPRTGQRRATPALTLGYTDSIGEGTSVGIEAGAIKGRGYATVDEMARGARGGRGGVNPTLNLVVGRRF